MTSKDLNTVSKNLNYFGVPKNLSGLTYCDKVGIYDLTARGAVVAEDADILFFDGDLSEELSAKANRICYLATTAQTEDVAKFFSGWDVEHIGVLEGKNQFIVSRNPPYPVYCLGLVPQPKCEKWQLDNKPSDYLMWVPRTDKQYYFLQWAYEKIKDLRQVMPMVFLPERHIMSPYYDGFSNLGFIKDDLSPRTKSAYREQLLELIVRMNNVGIAHNDLNPNNIMVKGDELVVVDWEAATIDVAPPEESLDLVGASYSKFHYRDQRNTGTYFLSLTAPRGTFFAGIFAYPTAKIIGVKTTSTNLGIQTFLSGQSCV